MRRRQCTSVLRGLGIELEADSNGKVRRPARIRWLRKDSHHMVPLSTNNLYCRPDDSVRDLPSSIDESRNQA